MVLGRKLNTTLKYREAASLLEKFFDNSPQCFIGGSYLGCDIFAVIFRVLDDRLGAVTLA